MRRRLQVSSSEVRHDANTAVRSLFALTSSEAALVTHACPPDAPTELSALPTPAPDLLVADVRSTVTNTEKGHH